MEKIRQGIRKLNMVLPSEVKIRMFNLLQEHYKDNKKLAFHLGCDEELVEQWSTGKKISEEYMPKILAFGLQNCPEAKTLLKEFFYDLRDLYSDLNILKDEETSRKDEINQFMEALDRKNKAVILYLWKNKHASIRELSNLISAPTDAYTLCRIREHINPTAKNILGKQIMQFEESKIDSVTGEKILFCWWLSEDFELIELQKEMLDIFDEKNYLKIVTELPNVKEKDIKVDVEGNLLTISADNQCKRVPLFYAVEESAEKTYKNGILEIKLQKVAKC